MLPGPGVTVDGVFLDWPTRPGLVVASAPLPGHRPGMSIRIPVAARALVLAGLGLSCAGAPPTSPGAARPTVPSHLLAPTGDVHDFEYFAGGWRTVQRRLKTRGAEASDWEEFPATLCMTPYLGGAATVDEIFFPTKGWSGLTVRTFDPEKRRWSIYWVSSRSGTLGTPVVGGFQGARGEFFGEDEDGGRPVDGPVRLGQARPGPRALGAGLLLRRPLLGDELDRRLRARRRRGDLRARPPERSGSSASG